MKNKILGLVIILIILIGGFCFFKLRNQAKPLDQSNQSLPKPSNNQQNDPPQVVSTKPDPLNDNIVSGDQIIEITFNRPLENVGEFKVRIEPKIDYKVELSGDRKTAKIIPTKPYPLGATFTLSIGPDSKFDGVGNWGQDKSFQFRTIKYTGV